MENVTPILYMGAATPLPQEEVENLTYTYDANGRVSTIATDSTTYTFTYDKFGNTTSIKAGTATLATYEYANNNGKLESMTYGNGIIAKYFYDQLDRVVEMCYTDSSGTTLDKFTYTYRADGRLHTVESVVSKRGYEYSYDAKGQLTGYQEYDTETKDRLLAIGQNFDQDGNLTSALLSVGYTHSTNTAIGYLQYTYTYNSLDELSSATLRLADWETEIDRTFVYDKLHRTSSVTTSYGTEFTRYEGYNYKNIDTDRTTAQVSNYTSTVNNTISTYSYTYDDYGNITAITDIYGKVTKYYYDDLQQLIREDNPYYNQTYEYTYDHAGNRTSKKFYGYTTERTISSYPNLTLAYTYNGDRLLRCVGLGSDNTYDGLGNPITYSTGLSTATLTWQNGRQLATATKGSTSVSYKYNDTGIRTSKTVNGVEHIYTLNGSQIVSEAWGDITLIYLYDENGSPLGFQYRTSNLADGVFFNFFFEKNLFGDIVAVYNASGVKVLSYYYDAWGNHTTTWHNSTGNNTYAQYNPFRYRGYYYDTETEFYYLQSRYYDPVTGRFLNADGYINANGDLIGFNMYAYCSNNPVMYTDPKGTWPQWLTDYWNNTVTWFNDNIVQPVTTVINNVKEDVQNFDTSNTSEEKVLKSNYFSYYQGNYGGAFVLNLPIGDNAFSFGIIFMGTGVPDTDYDTVKHEYGHTVQYDNMGFWDYLTQVGIPSVTGFLKDPLPYSYYTSPWEKEADDYGMVNPANRDTSDPWTQADGYYTFKDLIYEIFH
ncbi:MAG: RHS repeat-associated core domain-containing protein [Clostridia bacterium]|nr:RHS repeat-associated core domain-containing protein [Clostridia bacterium]